MEKIFVNGMISKEVNEKAPDFIMGELSIKVPDLIIWLQTVGAQNATNGWINLTVKKSKLGKRYIEVNNYKAENAVVAQVKPTAPVTPSGLTTSDIDYGEVINPNDIPF